MNTVKSVFGLAVLLGVLAWAPFAQAASSINITSVTPTSGTCQLSNSPVSITMDVTADAPPGQLQQYHVQVDWQAETIAEEPGSIDNGLGNFGTGHGTSSLNLTATHTYTTPGTHTIKTRIYHQGAPGNDNQADAVDSEVVCIVSPLVVEKTAETSLARSYEWTIEKTADADDLILAKGEAYDVNYDVIVDADSTDSDWAVTGNISITNPLGNPTVTGLDVEDEMTGAIAADVSCPSTTITPGSTLVCTYSASLPDGATRTNTATVTTDEPLLGGTANASVDFSEATVTEIDEDVVVTDTLEGSLGTVNASEAPYTFEYALRFGKDILDADVTLECGVTATINTASFAVVDDSNDTGATGGAHATVNSTINCPIGCTLTQGYWKTHNDSFKGGAPTDDNWENLSNLKENTLLNYSGGSATWFSIFWTAPKGGNVWYQLAHQYMAAYLNDLNDADVPVNVASALTNAGQWLSQHSPTQKLKTKDAADAAGWASLLGSYNEGIIGPGHCSEQNPA